MRVNLLLLLLSLVAPAAGQHMLVVQKDEVVAALLYGVGLLAFLSVFVVQWPGLAHRWPLRMPKPALPKYVCILGGLSGILLLVSLKTINTAPARIVVGAWATSLLLALTAAIPVKSLLSRLAIRSWSALIASWGTRELVGVGLIVLVGAGLRLYDLAGIPSGIHGDEAGEALIAISFLEGKGPNPFGTAFLGDRALGFFLQAPFFSLFGRTVTAMRLFSALAGVVTLPVFYLLMRRLFSPRPALIALALLASSAVHVNYSRLGLNVNQIPLLMCISMYCLRRGQESRRAFWWLASGIFGGLAVYFAFAGALVVLTIALYLAYLLVTRFSNWRAWITGVTFSMLGGAMALAPIPAYMLGQHDPYTEHAVSRLVFGNWEWVASTHRASTWGEVLLGQLKANVLYFLTGHDFGPFYGFAGAPLLSVLLGPLAALGLLLMLLRVRDERYGMLVVWYWTMVLVGGVITINSPQSHRLLPAVLPALVGVALVLDWLMEIGPRLLPAPFASTFLVLSVALPIIAGCSDSVNYFSRAVGSRPWEQGTLHGRYVASLGSGCRVYSLAAPQLHFDDSVTRFLAPNVEGDSLLNPALRLPLAVPADRDLAFLVFPNMYQYLPLLRSLYPGAEMEAVQGGDGGVVFNALRVPKAEVARWQGLTARYGDIERVESDASDLGSSAPSYPIDATWFGSLYVEREGSYSFRTAGEVSELLVDGIPVAAGELVALWTGWHSLQMRGSLPDAESRVKLEWAAADQPLSVVPTRQLDARKLAGNLRGRWTVDGGMNLERRDRTIGFRNLGELFDGQGSVSVHWEGRLNIPMDGEYGFSLRSTGQTAISIDGKPVVTNAGDPWANQQTTQTVRLTAGSHPFILSYTGRGKGGFLEALWSVPGGSPEVIPPEVFDALG